jgi:AraC-like DNA-binding protein
MPIYMDVHIVPGVKAKNVAEAHRQDLLHQEEYGCKCMTYWIDETRESIFCLIEAPDKDAVREMHHKAHGLIPNKIIEVSSSVVQAFLGRIYDPEEAETTREGLKIFSDPSFRILLVTKTTDPLLLQHNLGKEKATTLLSEHNSIIRKNLVHFDGTEVEHPGTGFIISFTSAAKAVGCAMSIEQDLPQSTANALEFKMSLNSGEPVSKSNQLFGDAIQKAQFLCTLTGYFRLAVTSSVKELVAKDHLPDQHNRFLTLTPQDEAFLEKLYTCLEDNWQNPDFDVEDYGKNMAMSKSQLYRKTIALTGFSPNALLKEFRLEKARELLKKGQYTISQVTYEAGFTSPSYFTKCFKKKFGLLPVSYMELVQ